MTSDSRPPYVPRDEVTTAENDTLIIRKYCVTSNGGINAFSSRFRKFANDYKVMVNNDGSSYNLGPTDRKVIMSFCSNDGLSDIVITAKNDLDIDEIEKVLNRRFNAGLVKKA